MEAYEDVSVPCESTNWLDLEHTAIQGYYCYDNIWHFLALLVLLFLPSPLNLLSHFSTVMSVIYETETTISSKIYT